MIFNIRWSFLSFQLLCSQYGHELALDNQAELLFCFTLFIVFFCLALNNQSQRNINLIFTMLDKILRLKAVILLCQSHPWRPDPQEVSQALKPIRNSGQLCNYNFGSIT